MEPSQSKRLALRPEWRDKRLSLVASIEPSTQASSSPRSAKMDSSPLIQLARPEVFEPKVFGLYRDLFKEDEEETKSEGFFHELFLLRPNPAYLRQTLEGIDASILLHTPHQPQQLLLQCIDALKDGEGPSDGNALDTLTVFFTVILAKSYSNPNSDIIEVLAGLDNVDAVFTDLVTALDAVIKDGRDIALRQKAVGTALAVVAGGYQTALVSYFIHRDLFPALMKMISELETHLDAAEPLMLAGLLANYNKFEMQNQYGARFADLANVMTMTSVVESVAATCVVLRERYVAIQDDSPAGWSVSGTLSYVGLGVLTGTKATTPSLTEEQQVRLFGEQPAPEAASLLTLYDFVHCNKSLAQHFIAQPPFDANSSAQAPFSAFLSFTSYLYQHAYRSARSTSYAHLTLLILTLLVEDASVTKLLCETTATVRLSRQRPPFLPLSKPAERPYTATLLDLLVDGLNHNLRKRLDSGFYLQSTIVTLRLLSYLSRTRTKVAYHWSELWRCLLSFVRFLTTYADDLRHLLHTSALLRAVVDVLVLALTGGDAFLPTSTDYDDLFYKLVESGEALIKLRDTFALAKPDEQNAPINTLVGVSEHYKELIESQRAKQEHLGPKEVARIIKQGYETLRIEGQDGVVTESVRSYREADHKAELKRIARTAVADAVLLVSSSG